MTKQVYTAKDLQELLGVSESKAVYKADERRITEKRIFDRHGQDSGCLCTRAVLLRWGND